MKQNHNQFKDVRGSIRCESIAIPKHIKIHYEYLVVYHTLSFLRADFAHSSLFFYVFCAEGVWGGGWAFFLPSFKMDPQVYFRLEFRSLFTTGSPPEIKGHLSRGRQVPGRGGSAFYLGLRLYFIFLELFFTGHSEWTASERKI